MFDVVGIVLDVAVIIADSMLLYCLLKGDGRDDGGD